MRTQLDSSRHPKRGKKLSFLEDSPTRTPFCWSWVLKQLSIPPECLTEFVFSLRRTEKVTREGRGLPPWPTLSQLGHRSPRGERGGGHKDPYFWDCLDFGVKLSPCPWGSLDHRRGTGDHFPRAPAFALPERRKDKGLSFETGWHQVSGKCCPP